MRMNPFLFGSYFLGTMACGTEEDTEPNDQPDCPRVLDSGSPGIHTGGDTAANGDSAEPADTGEGSDTSTPIGPGDTGDSTDYFVVDQLGVFFDGAILDGQVSAWSRSGKTKQGNFVIFAVIQNGRGR